ncbi:MAG: hypothetical protein E7167_00445 [Firmicutes bacterium]|nr:hypothetical protein [Bacillota bacterium]
MSENKQILKFCPNFYKIINFNPIMGDELTERIIRMYQEYIFRINIHNEDEVNEIKELDAAVAKYIDDYSFRKEVQRQIMSIKVKNDCKDIIKYFIDAIIRIFSTYEDYTTRVIYISRWI